MLQLNAEAFERRRFFRRADDCRPGGGAVIATICVLSLLSGAVGFIAGIWFGWFLI